MCAGSTTSCPLDEDTTLREVNITDEIRYPGPIEAVVAMLADPDFVHAKGEAMHAQDIDVAIDGDPAGQFTVTWSRSQATDQIPEQLRGFVGAMLTLRQVDTWSPPLAGQGGHPEGSRTGGVEVEVVGFPVRFSGTMVMTPAGEETVVTLEGELKASIPFVGGKVEQAAEPSIRGAVRAEARTAEDWLAR